LVSAWGYEENNRNPRIGAGPRATIRATVGVWVTSDIRIRKGGRGGLEPPTPNVVRAWTEGAW